MRAFDTHFASYPKVFIGHNDLVKIFPFLLSPRL